RCLAPENLVRWRSPTQQPYLNQYRSAWASYCALSMTRSRIWPAAREGQKSTLFGQTCASIVGKRNTPVMLPRFSRDFGQAQLRDGFWAAIERRTPAISTKSLGLCWHGS